MEIITIAGDDRGGLDVVDGKEPRAKLAWEAPGLQIYLVRVNAKNWGRAANLAMNHALSMHIPIKSLQRR